MFLQLCTQKTKSLSATTWSLTCRQGLPRMAQYTAPHHAFARYPWCVNNTYKIKFKRKGGWIRSFSNWCTPYVFKFGYGHPVVQLGQRLFRHRYKRYLTQHCMLWTYADAELPRLAVNTPGIKAFNCYTQRGIRGSCFYLLKRKGKESKYTALKSKIF